MQRNKKTIAATVALLLIVVVGALMWTRNSRSPEVGERSELTAAQWRALGLSSAANADALQRNYAEAIKKYQQSLRIQKDPATQIHLAVVLLRIRRRDEAIQLLKEVAQEQNRAGKSAAVILAKMERNPNWGMPKS